MRLQPKVSLIAIASLSVFWGCAPKGKGFQAVQSTPPSPLESLLKLSSHPMDQCPELSGNWECKDDDGTITKQRISLLQEGSGYRLVTEEPDKKKTFFDYIITNYMFDERVVVDGTIQDKTLGVRKGVETLYKAVTSPLSRATLKALGIDFEKHLKDLDPISLQAGYVGYCNQNSLNLHYVAGGKFGARSSFRLSTPDTLVGSGMMTQDGSNIEKQSTTCKLISRDIPKVKLASSNERALRESLDPSTIDFILERSSGTSEPKSAIRLKFSKPGLFSKGSDFALDKGFEGPIDQLGKGVKFDVPANWASVYLDWITGEVKSRSSTGEITTIGETYEDNGTWVIKFSVDVTEKRSTFLRKKILILEPKSKNPLGRRTL